MKGKLQIEQEQNKKNRREQMKEERRQMLVCDCYKELKILVGNNLFCSLYLVFECQDHSTIIFVWLVKQLQCLF